MNPWWSIALTVGALVSCWLIGDRRRVGYLVGNALQAGWLAYAVVTEQWAFVLSAVVFVVVNTRNYRKWKHLDDAEEAARAHAN